MQIVKAEIKDKMLHMEFSDGLPPMKTYLNIADNDFREALLILLSKDVNIDRTLDDVELQAINTVAQKVDNLPARAMELDKMSFRQKVKFLFKK